MKNFALILIALSSLVMSCSSEPGNVKPKLQGTENAGGGDIEGSTAKQVEEAILRIQSEISDISRVKNTYDQLKPASEYYKHFDKSIITQAKRLFINANKITSLDKQTRTAYKKNLADQQDISCHNPVQYLKSVEVKFAYNNECKGADGHNSDASVNGFHLGAEVCFNIKKIQRIPEAGLNKYLYGLWWHEILHLMGERNELVADFMEKWATFSYDNYKDKDLKLLGMFIQNIIKNAQHSLFDFEPSEKALIQIEKRASAQDLETIEYFMNNSDKDISELQREIVKSQEWLRVATSFFKSINIRNNSLEKYGKKYFIPMRLALYKSIILISLISGEHHPELYHELEFIDDSDSSINQMIRSERNRYEQVADMRSKQQIENLKKMLIQYKENLYEIQAELDKDFNIEHEGNVDPYVLKKLQSIKYKTPETNNFNNSNFISVYLTTYNWGLNLTTLLDFDYYDQNPIAQLKNLISSKNLLWQEHYIGQTRSNYLNLYIFDDVLLSITQDYFVEIQLLDDAAQVSQDCLEKTKDSLINSSHLIPE